MGALGGARQGFEVPVSHEVELGDIVSGVVVLGFEHRSP